MNRRSFLSLFGVGVAGLALEQAIPLGRVWSFPKKIIVPWHEFPLPYFGIDVDQEFSKQFAIGSMIHVRMPERFLVKRLIDKHLYEVIPDPPPLPYKIISS